jgi:DNA primase
MAVLQQPLIIGRELVQRASQVEFSNASLGVVRDGVMASMDSFDSPEWLARVIDEVPAPFATLVKELGLAPLPEREGRELTAYCQAVTTDLIARDLLRRKAELLGQSQRTDAAAEPEKYRALQVELVRIEAERRALRTE